jgi:hypothetical protein
MPGIDTAPGALVGSPNIGTLSGNAIWDQLVRNIIMPTIIDGRNQAVPLLGLLKTSPKHVDGRFFGENVRFGRNYGGTSAIHPEGNMPDPLSQGIYQYMSRVVDAYLRIKLSGALLRRAQGDGMVSMLDPLQFESEGAIDDLAIKQEIQLHGDGSGRRAEVSSVAAGSVTVRLNQDNVGTANCTSRPTIYLDVGMRIAFASAAGTIRTVGGQQAFYVISVPSSNTVAFSLTPGGGVFDLTAGAVIQVGDWLVDAARDSSLSSTPYMDTAFKQEPMGIEGIFRDVGVLDGMAISTAGQQTGSVDYSQTSVTAQAVGFQGVQVNGAALTASYPPPSFNVGNVFTAGGGAARQISDTLLQKLVSDPMEINNTKIGVLCSAWAMYTSYLDTLIGDKRFNSTTIAGGHANFGQDSGVTFNGMNWFKSRFALNNKVWGFDLEWFQWYENQSLQVATAPGGNQYERVRDKDAFWLAMVESGQLIVHHRQRAGGVLVDVY